MQKMNSPKLIYPELSYKILGLLFEIHNTLGRFCNEKQYSNLLESLLKKAGLPYEREKTISFEISDDFRLTHRADFIIDNKILIELKAKSMIGREEYYQVRKYLEALGIKLGILVNFRGKYLQPRRILNSGVKEYSYSQFAY